MNKNKAGILGLIFCLLNAKMAGIVLWENPSPNVNFAAQDVTLSSDNYDVLEIYYKQQATSTNTLFSVRVLKGYDTRLSLPSGGSTGATNLIRGMTSKSATVYNIGNCTNYSPGSSSTNNVYVIPVKIIGYKS